MSVPRSIGCQRFPCRDVSKDGHARCGAGSRGGWHRDGIRGARVFPSCLQAGPAFFIEKSKRAMIAEDIAAALTVAAQSAPGEGEPAGLGVRARRQRASLQEPGP